MTTMGWPYLKEPKPAATCSDSTKSYREKTYRKTKNQLGRCHKQGCGTDRRWFQLEKI